jgi:uncharacterized repeat protein (TIGR01451 family)
VNAQVGVVSYEGDLGTTGDSMALNGKQLSDAVTPANNFFNASISNLGVLQTANNPNYVNQMGFDAKVVQAPAGAIPNSATSATITLSTSGDGYFPGVVTTAIDLYAPNLVETKSVTDLTSGNSNSLDGDVLQYTVNVTNSGQDAAGNVVLTDAIPANTTYVPGSLRISSGANAGPQTDASGDDEAEFNTVANDVVFRLGAGANAMTGGTLAIGASTTISFEVRINPGVPGNTVVSNQASVAYTGATTGFSFNSFSNIAAVTVGDPVSDLGLTKTVSDKTPNVGDQITYTVRLTNSGPNDATGVVVSDLLPSGLQLVNATASQGVYGAGLGTWTVGTVPDGGSATLTVVALVVSPNPQTNTASIVADNSIDPNPSNNTASVTEIPQRADLDVKKTVNNPTPNVGGTVVYTVTATNKGPNNATGVTVTDLLPSGLTFDSSDAGTAYDPTTGLWTIGDLADGTSAVLNITATVVSPHPQDNTATISHADQFDPNTNNNSASALETPQQADLVLSKVVNNSTPNVGDTIDYTITLADAGPDAATDGEVQDALPVGLTFVSATPSEGTYDPTTGIWTVGTVDTTTTQRLVIAALVNSPGAIVNSATITHSDQYDPNPNNNTATSLVNPQKADLELTKTVNNSTPNVGDTITYTVTLSDHGPNDATGVTVSDLLPAGLTFVSATPSEGSYNAATGIWTVGTVTTATPQMLQVEATVVSPDAQFNSATITNSDQFDPDPTNNTAGALETPQQADLVLSKVADNKTPNVGDTVHFTITLTDAGPDTATGVTVRDLLPTGLNYVSATPTQGTYNPTTGIWTVGTVTTSSPQTLVIAAVVTNSEEEINTATISHSDQFDPDPANNTAKSAVTPQQADLELVKQVNDPTPNVGDTITYTVTLTDRGPDNATNVVVSDPLPAGLTFVSATPSEGSYNPTTGVWTVGAVTTAVPQTLLIQATVVSPNATTNTATITHSDQFDPNTGNNSSSAVETPQQADLELGKTVDNSTPNVGDTIHYTITLADAGPDAATNVTVLDSLPAGVTFESATPSEGTYDPTTAVWTVGTVDTTMAQTLVIAALVNDPGAIVNTATISHSDQYDPDPANNTAKSAVTPQQADLELVKQVNDPTPNVGDTITYTLTLTDNGPDAATGVAVSDRLPAGLTFVSATPSQGNFDPTTGIWTVGDVTPVTPQTLQIQAIVVSSSATTNTAAVVHSNQYDPNPNNNSSSATETPQQADLTLTKTVDDPTPNVGDIVHYTITVNDAGPDAATNVSIQDLLPTGLAFVSATPSEGTYDPTTGVWTAGTVDTTAAQTLTIAAQVTGPGVTTNIASILHSDQFNPTLLTTTHPVTVTPQQADLAIAKIVNNAAPHVGNTITYTVTLTDQGPDPATNVTVQDSLLVGLTFVSATPSQGTYDPATGVWTVGTVDTQFVRTLQIVARVTVPGALTNTATIGHSDQFDPNPDNNSSSVTETGISPPAPPPPDPSPAPPLPPPLPPPEADVTLTKQVNQSDPIFGTPVTYTLIVHNNGPTTATDVVATDTMPAGLMFMTTVPSQGSFNPGSGQWTIGTLPNGATVTLQITDLVAAIGPITNAASVTARESDPDPANNVSSVTIDSMRSAALVSKSMFLSSSDPSNAQMAAEEAMFDALMPRWANLWDALLSVEQNMLAAQNGPGNGGVPIFEGNWSGSPLVVYANPFCGQVTAVQVGTLDCLYENNAVACVRRF